ncbi:MAG: LPS export ABC transporter permease LptG [Bdellovibrionales bacterium]|nr:LPS export ABC transporter permease LptG [Bdellovibrionales bacterium]
MKTIDRYIIALFLKNIAIAAFGLTAIYLFQQITGMVLEETFPIRQVLIFNLFQLPAVFVQMLPPSVLIGTVLTLSGLNRTNELTAVFSLGIGLKRIMALLLVFVFAISLGTLFLQDSVLPGLFKRKTNYYWREMKKRTDFYLDVKQNRVWYRSKNLIYNLKAFDLKTQQILGMTVYSFDDRFNLVQTVESDKALFTPQGWKLLTGTVTQFVPNDPFPVSEKFNELRLQIPETPKDFQEIEKEVDGLRLGELKNYIDRNQNAGLDTKSYQVKFHSRFSLSFIPLVMCMIGIPFSVRGRREGGLAKDLAMCLAITFFYWLFYSIGLSLGSNGAVPPVMAAWGPTLIFMAFALVLVARQEK